MSDEIREIDVEDLDSFISIVEGAFPVIELHEPGARSDFKERLSKIYLDPTRTLYGFYRNNQLLGGMILYEFTMNVRSIFLPVGGVGLVAVDLLHKKEHVAKKMIKFCCYHFKMKGFPLLILYPFRPDFYHNMGFGYGTKINQYRIAPSAFRRGKDKSHLRYLNDTDIDNILDCYNRFVEKKHGMILGSPRDIEFLFSNPSKFVVGYEEFDSIAGYLAFHFEKFESDDYNTIWIDNLIFDNREVLGELLTFVHTQLDQFEWVTLTTHDETFHHLLSDPRSASRKRIPHIHHESNIQGIGLMYRILDLDSVFNTLGDAQFNGIDCRLRINVTDGFLSENNDGIIVHFQNGRPILGKEDSDIVIDLDISDFSSLLMGVVPFKKLYQYDMAEISHPKYIDIVNQLFWIEEKPMCLTRF